MSSIKWTIATILTLLCLIALSTALKKGPLEGTKLYCDGCKAVVKEMIKIINNKKESEVMDIAVAEALEICSSVDPFRQYEHPPPDTLRVCNRLLDKYEEDIENLLMKRVKDTEREICFKLAKACTDKIIAKDSKAASNTKDKDSKTEL